MTLAGAVVSCKKSNSGSSGYHLTATIGGTNHAFNTSPLYATSNVGGVTLIAVEGFTTQAGEMFNLSINNSPSGKPIVAGTYTDTSANFEIVFEYVKNATTAYVGGTLITAAAGTSVKNHTKIIITSIDAHTIRGTISGDAFLNSDITEAPTTVTNGDFYAAFGN